MSEPIVQVLYAVMRLLGICSAGMDGARLSAVALQAALDELVAIAAGEPQSVLTAAAVQTGELFLAAANAPLSPVELGSPRDTGRPYESGSWLDPTASLELASATGGLRVLLAALSAAYAIDLVETCLDPE